MKANLKWDVTLVVVAVAELFARKDVHIVAMVVAKPPVKDIVTKHAKVQQQLILSKQNYGRP